MMKIIISCIVLLLCSELSFAQEIDVHFNQETKIVSVSWGQGESKVEFGLFGTSDVIEDIYINSETNEVGILTRTNDYWLNIVGSRDVSFETKLYRIDLKSKRAYQVGRSTFKVASIDNTEVSFAAFDSISIQSESDGTTTKSIKIIDNTVAYMSEKGFSYTEEALAKIEENRKKK